MTIGGNDRQPRRPGRIWEHPEPPTRKPPPPLRRAVIVAAAMRIADAEGIDAVSLRRVAAELHVGPMRLYGYLDSKSDLLDLMLDAALGEIDVPGPPSGDWRSDLRHIADGVQRVARRHPWLVSLLGTRQPYGPNGLGLIERAFAALDGIGLDAAALAQAVSAVFGYVVGYIQLELLPDTPPHSGDVEEEASQEQVSSYLRSVAGRYPTLARVFAELGAVDPQDAFHASLEYVLDGVASRITSRNPS